jgi:hypothetical protein
MWVEAHAVARKNQVISSSRFIKAFALGLFFLFTSLLVARESVESVSPEMTTSEAGVISKYPWRKKIVTTYFWIGQGSSSYSETTNYASAWDTQWTKNYGGMDDPTRRVGFLPSRFAATKNPFYVALPFNDVKYPELAKKWIPWYKTPARGQRYVSQCKGRWLQIRTPNGKSCFAQWEDVGPIRYDYASYVFGNDRPREFNKAGLDVSPAVRDYLGLTGLDFTDWRFVEAEHVPPGPWWTYYEQAIIFSAIKARYAREREKVVYQKQPQISSSER